MNEWLIVAGAITLFITISGFIFGWGWKIIQDVKDSAHKRIGRLEEEFKDMEKTCNLRLATYVNKDDVRLIDHRMENLDKDMKSGFAELTGRIDNLLLAFTNGNGKRKAK
jgi:hypothetical protein